MLFLFPCSLFLLHLFTFTWGSSAAGKTLLVVEIVTTSDSDSWPPAVLCLALPHTCEESSLSSGVNSNKDEPFHRAEAGRMAVRH